MKKTEGGICAAKGYTAAGLHCGIKKYKKDLALIVSDKRASCACVYTKNLVKGAPIAVTKRNVSDGYAQAVICNSGNANTCNADGEKVAYGMCELVEKYAGIQKSDVIVASTGVIGKPLDITPIENSMSDLVSSLGNNSSDCVEAIMTTDTFKKEAALEFEVGGVVCRMGGIAKGSGMIHPNMATMLVFITTDAAIAPEMLQKALSEVVTDTYNMISVDGDTSTNDMVSVLANGEAGNEIITAENEAYSEFKSSLNELCAYLCRMIASDGEGATKLLECKVLNSKEKNIARICAKAVICSSLVKAAMFGSDANWGRVLCALGYSGAEIDVNRVDVTFISASGAVKVCKDGAGVSFSEEEAKKVLSEKEIIINIDLKTGEAEATAWGCDLTYDYVKINGDYRT
ncbi:MAG: bifunctional glutamate N-acetyltransferase/amino-acid acetyltransferase ArgJ [Oscillospiraceae bacterium]|nr:bifunctional glutamate N-acetyltransferase/amino-acid acetyltransferase ArgJ [Oscillospiraceae bacterium]